ncbi:nuclease-related domain-containing protein [Blastococcus sp. SYSU DS0533]
MTEQHAGWEDLSTRRPGSTAGAAAAQARAAAPVRSVLARLMGVHTEERAWRLGADGERHVGLQLERLVRGDARWRCLHAIPVGRRGSDIDHLVIGPGGVFSINAKNHPGARLWVGGDTFMVNGVRQPYVRNSRHEAERATRLLSDAVGHPIAVRGVVVPVGAHSLSIKRLPADVAVVPRRQLRRWLSSLPQALPDVIVESLYERARRSTTWLT